MKLHLSIVSNKKYTGGALVAQHMGNELPWWRSALSECFPVTQC